MTAEGNAQTNTGKGDESRVKRTKKFDTIERLRLASKQTNLATKKIRRSKMEATQKIGGNRLGEVEKMEAW